MRQLKEAELNGKSDEYITGLRLMIASLRNMLNGFCAELLKPNRGGISKFEWKDKLLESHEQSLLFPPNGFGRWILDRGRIIDLVDAARDEQLRVNPGSSTSVYLSGCRGMGKSCILALVAKHLKAKGWEVYGFSSAADIPQGVGEAFLDYAHQNKDTQIAVLVDEVMSNPNSGLFTLLLKGSFPNIFTIGAAVPFVECIPPFAKVVLSRDLALRRDDADVKALVEHWKQQVAVGVEGIDGELVSSVSSFLISYCGGHVFPVLAFMKYFFTTAEGRHALMGGYDAFFAHFNNANFKQSRVYQMVWDRCFDGSLADVNIRNLLTRVLSGHGDAADVNTLIRYGWWDPCMNVSSMHELQGGVKPVD